MALPTLTGQERADALAKAQAARATRAKAKDDLKSHRLTLAGLLTLASRDDSIGKLRVRAALEALPGVGKVRAQDAMARAGIAANRRLRGLGHHQRGALLALFPD